MSAPGRSARTIPRRWATLAVLSFLVLGLVHVLQLVLWGADPLWGFAVLPPVVFFTVLGWFAFKTGVAREGDG